MSKWGYWIGWPIWAVLIPWLLAQAPQSLPLVTWSHSEGVITVTWSYLVFGFVMFWCWPVVFRASRVKRRLAGAARAVAAGPRMLWAGMRRSPLFFVSWVVLLAAWQVASYLAPPGTLEHPLVPGWDYVLGDTFFGMSSYWTVQVLDFGFVTFVFEGLAPLTIFGGEPTWPAVFLAIAYHSGMTLARLFSGLVIGLALGLLTGLGLPYWPAVRHIAWIPMNFLRMIPLLVAAPWLQLVVGASFVGIVAYVAFGVWTILVVATINAVGNVPDRYIESARTLGASRLLTYYRVIVPGTLPELRTALLLAVGGSWSLTIVAEFLGFPAGLGHMANRAVQETNTARLLVVAIFVAIYSLTTFFVVNEGFKKVVNWMPKRTSAKTDFKKVAGAAGGT